MEKKVFLLYAGNAWLNTSSLHLVAVCSSVEKAIELACIHSNEGEEPLEEDDQHELEMNLQTYGRDENYLICECEIDKIDG